MSKILLIKPRFLVGFDFQETITQPMGLIYIASTLKYSGHDIRIHDCALDYEKLNILHDTLIDWKPDFIGISIIITETEYTKRLMQSIRSVSPHVPIIFGGPWPSANPQEALEKLGANFVVIGEGERVFPELIDALNNGRPAESIPGIACIAHSDLIMNSARHLTEEELNHLPFPAWDLLDHNLYAHMHSMAGIGSRRYMTIVTSRGCPFKCAYCHQTMGKVFRKRSAESVLAEIKELRFKHGFRDFEIVDDCFNLDRGRMRAILTGIRDEIGDIKLHFPNAVRSDMLEPEDMPLFRQAGTISAAFAIETASPRLQKMIHKNLNIEKALRTINASVKAGIYSTGYFMIGFPTETREEALETVQLATRSPLHRVLFFNPIPFPGTDLAKMAEAYLQNKNVFFNPQQMNYQTSTINISAMTDGDLQQIFRNAYRRFYLNPRRILSLLRLVIKYPQVFPMKRIAGLFLLKILLKKGKNN